MNKEFSYYMDNINESIKKDEGLKRTFKIYEDEILIKLKEYYEKYKDIYEFDNLLNINSEHCKTNSFGCINCSNCVSTILASDCSTCVRCYVCSKCDNCTRCRYSSNCVHCVDCAWCENCNNCDGCRNCKNCEKCSDCENIKDCQNYYANEYNSENDSEYDVIDLSSQPTIIGDNVIEIYEVDSE